MWAQMIKVRVKRGKEDDVRKALEQLLSAEQPDSGLLQQTLMRDQKDPEAFYLLAVFESEEKARAREADPRRKEATGAMNSALREALAGPPEFMDCEVVLRYDGQGSISQ